MSFLPEPLLDKPVRGWSHDLPAPNRKPAIEPISHLMTNSPNHVDDIYIELARSTARTRGVGVWLAIMCALLTAWATFMLGFYLISETKLEVALLIITALSVIIPLLSSIFMWRIDTEAPRDEPIRFNRLRRKVYVYRFYHNTFRLFSRTAWYSRAEVYEWDNLRAEAYSVYGPMGSGGLIEGVSLAVVEPGTTNVIDRFHFAHGGLEGQMYWALAQIFMQQGPRALPEFEYLPRDWNNEDVTLNLARYLAPKVRWPVALDDESRTAP